MNSPGKEVRLSRLFDKKSRRVVIVTMDHAIAHGVLPGIRNTGDTIDKIVAGRPNAMTIHKGLTSKYYSKLIEGEICLICKLSGFSPYNPSLDTQFTEVKEAIKLGADAVAYGASTGDTRQDDMLKTIGHLARECDEYGMPLTVHIYPKGNLIKKEDYYKVENIMYAARAAAELGADIVKTWYTGSSDTFRQVVEACPVPVVIAGGPPSESVNQFLTMVRGAVDGGASGVAIGRNVWGSKNPTLMVKALRMIVHENRGVQETISELGLE
ncbi:MAG: class I fructose-bisphosphate aldolase [Nitrososphaeria archaeon]